MNKQLVTTKSPKPRKYGRTKIEVEMREGHPIDDEVMKILDSKKPDYKQAQFLRDAILLMNQLESGDFKPFLSRFGGQMLMQGIIGTALPQPRQVAVHDTIIAIPEPPIKSEDSAQNLFDFLID